MSRGLVLRRQAATGLPESPAFADGSRRLSRNVRWSYVAWSASAFAPVVTVPFCVRYLGARLYGEWLMILSLTAYLGLANLGIAQTVGNRIAEATAFNRRGEIRTLVATGFWTYALLAIGLIAALVTVIPVIADHWLRSAGASAALIIYIVLICLAMPARIYQAALRGFERVDCEQALDALSTLARTALAVIALAAGGKLIAIAMVNGCSALLAAALAYPLARRIGGAIQPLPERFQWHCLRSLIRPSAAFLALQAGTTLTLGIDNLVIGAVLGAAAVTRYAVPFRLIWMAALVFTVAVNAAMPTITGHYALAQQRVLVRHYLIALRLALLFATCGAMLLWTAGPSLIGWWAGPEVFPGRAVFAMQIALFAILAVTAPSTAILAATTRHYRYAASTIVEGLLNLALSLLWVRRYGLAGVIGATIAASLLTTSWYVSAAAPAVIGLGWRPMLHRLALPITISTGALAVTVIAGRFAAPFACFMFACTTATIVLTAYLALVFDTSERQSIIRYLSGSLAAGSAAVRA
ncbi:MAG TPA: oligosaccharide flippase family protein [Candidatus Binataceae bacterium]|nr:oligosaccharide flippase family protein [Candidatus Binataceae bacterium]